MDPRTRQVSLSRVLALAERQHGVVTAAQLRELGLSPDAIRYRVRRGRLHPVSRGVYAVGRPGVTREGRWMAAVLACGLEAVLSHESAAALWGIRDHEGGRIEVSIPVGSTRRRPGLAIHRRLLRPTDRTRCRGIAITTPERTLVDLATRLERDALEASVNAADARGLTDPERLREALGSFLAGAHGVTALREALDRRTFRLTDSALERLFLPIAHAAGLPVPRTRQWVSGFRVDFWWPELGLIVETDGLRYHRTPAAQARDRRRDQAHLAAGLVPLRFTHAQVAFEPDTVRATLAGVAARLPRRRGS